ncbi:unnamed protein product [Clonostachys rhizophaga]|uniref:Mitochondrial chaperone BCS1-B n=1 Tax=Clonostachys rhizophaga TaxID=160324 RepID=A0A9N9VED7_9HYPO|nr:unnamed protein product [Clonostachys rhizophaga]
MAASMMNSLTKLGILNHDKMPNMTTGTNGTAAAGLMDTLLASASQASPVLQLVLFVYRLLGLPFGLDPSILLTVAGTLWAAQYAIFQVYHYIEGIVEKHLMCSITVNDNDSIYHHLMEWLSKQPSLNNNRYLMAQTVWKSAWEEDEEDDENGVESHLFWTDGGQGDGGKYLNFSNQAARSVPRYVPALGTTGFWHKGTRFRVYRRKESFVNTSGWSAMKDQEEIKISSFGRSIAPIKLLLAEAKIHYYHDTHQKTTIYRPRQKEQRRDYSMWQQVARRPVRPMSTVVLDSEEKHNVLGDINEYLHPRTPRWYASRGIPLRRGYLFHGPPGTGKTSFSFALAGVFGIDIYVISLQDISVTEEDLATLFTRLPRRCIVLLEDIDTAGLRRDPDAEEEEEAKEKDVKAIEEKPTENGVKETATSEKPVANGTSETPKVNGTTEKKKPKKKAKKVAESESESDSSSDESDSDSEKRKKKRSSKKSSSKKDSRKRSSGKRGDKLSPPESISLSGLLNAIDGVASHEGRVLIMTTNKPESLDEALVRPGRVDMQVAFSHASRQQACELFHRMYEARWKQPHQIQAPNNSILPASLVTQDAKKQEGKLILPGQTSDEKPMTPEELKEISKEFGNIIPEGVFSPAEIQGFLLKRKASPRKAIADAHGWIEATIKQKEAKSKVSTVQ